MSLVFKKLDDIFRRRKFFSPIDEIFRTKYFGIFFFATKSFTPKVVSDDMVSDNMVQPQKENQYNGAEPLLG